MRGLRITGRLLLAPWHTLWWTIRAWPWLLGSLGVAEVLRIAAVMVTVSGSIATESVLLSTSIGVTLAVPSVCFAAALWAAASPSSFAQRIAGPLQRYRRRRRVRRDWEWLATRCGLASMPGPGRRAEFPRLVSVTSTPTTLVVRVRARAGQTVGDLLAAADAFATAQSAESVEAVQLGPGLVEYRLTMLELLDIPRTATAPRAIETAAVTLGRVSDGTAWRLGLTGRHTLVVGRSGAGKGSVLWGVAGNLAPASRAGLVRLWGIDLKGGVEVATGAAMFARVAMDERAAVELLRELVEVITARQAVMRGISRNFEPSSGNPVHVLLVDELAVLTNYAARDVVAEASKLLKLILTQGRAFGVIVVAFVQDPHKDTVAMRDLFTQTLALRLASAAETRMVLGDGMADLAPAHRIPPTMPGCGYLVADDGTVQRVRADWWPDELIRWCAAAFPAALTPTSQTDTIPEPPADPAALAEPDCCQ